MILMSPIGLIQTASKIIVENKMQDDKQKC